ncbi:MAG: 23S rRNA (uracil(1939)-C(5))-methyltransferase RlmD [Eubacteriales bacterium]|nr:23S rRNA (uracil(1939)-C(5))-methyltransferase RlmD [Eubacteriales bacterium]
MPTDKNSAASHVTRAEISAHVKEKRQIKRGERLIITFEGVNQEGQGIGHIDGYTVFADGVLPGESAEIEIIKTKSNYCIGRLLKLRTVSEKRREPFCPVYGRCGGCSLQHAVYEEQLRIKTGFVRSALKHIGGFEVRSVSIQDDAAAVVVHDTVGMDAPYNYRNKAQYPVGAGSGKIVAGFYEARSHRIVDHDKCDIQDKRSTDIKKSVVGFATRHGISVYDENTGRGLVRHVAVRVGTGSGEVMLIIVINGDDLPAREELVNELTRDYSGIESVVLNINKNNTNVIFGKEYKVIYGRGYIFDTLRVMRDDKNGGSCRRELKFAISPNSFYQVNRLQTEALYAQVLKYAGLTGSENAVDIYCGIGAISLFLALNTAKVYGIEIVDDAVRDARENAAINGVFNAEFIAGDAAAEFRKLCGNGQGIKADVVVLDPPRKGCDRALLEALISPTGSHGENICGQQQSFRPPKIIYVSCNPATLARDLKILAEGGYRVEEAQPFDMFPWTGHVECVVLMSRVEK